MAIHDPTPRWLKAGDALSQLVNVLTATDHTATTANESVSGRSYRQRLYARVALIDAFLGRGHCADAYHRDIERARQTILDAEGWPESEGALCISPKGPFHADI